MPTPEPGAQTGGPLVLGAHRAGDPFRTSWDAVAPEGGGTEHFLHTQTVGQSVITIEHGLGFRPQASLFSLDYGTKYRAFGVQHLSVNSLRISMDVPTPCVVVLS